VPAGCPEPYLYDRLFSGSEIAVGVEVGAMYEERASQIDSTLPPSPLLMPKELCISFALSPRAWSSLKSAANCSSSSAVPGGAACGEDETR
jgi:hypothetical protein